MEHPTQLGQGSGTTATPLTCPTRKDDGLDATQHGDSFKYSGDPIRKLNVEYNELARTWRIFQHNLHPSDRMNFQEESQTVRDVLRVMREAEEVWMSSKHRPHLRWSMGLLDLSTVTLSSHSALKGALLRIEDYCSLFYGVLQSIIKASVNYYKIAEGLSRALVEINEAVFSTKKTGLHPPSIVARPIANLYSEIFLFLGEFMYWYTKKAKCRLLKSHNLDVYSDFQYLVRTIRDTGSAITLELMGVTSLDDGPESKRSTDIPCTSLYLLEEARLSQVGLKGSDRHFASQNTITRQLIWDIQHDAIERKRMIEEKETILSHLFNLLSTMFRTLEKAGENSVNMATTAPEDIVIPRIRSLKGSKHKVSRIELQFSSKDLQDFFDNDEQIFDFDPKIKLLADTSIIVSLREWTQSFRSQVITITGPRVTSFPHPATLISAYYTYFARQIKLPIISHFCSLPQQTSNGITRAEQGLVALAYSLIRQLTEIAPPVLDCDISCDLSAERFHKFDGTLNTWKEVLSVLDALLDFVPPILFCVIDGLDLLDDLSTDEYLKSLVKVLIAHTKRPDPASIDGNMRPRVVLLKVLFTMSGEPNTLLEIPSDQELIVTDSLRVEQPAEHSSLSDPDTMMGDC